MFNSFELPDDLNTTNQMVLDAAFKHGVKIKQVNEKFLVMGYGRSVYKVRINSMPSSFNDKATKKLANDKQATNELLRSHGLPTPQSKLFGKDELDSAWQWAQQHLPVVIKPNTGRLGRGVFIEIDSYAEFTYAFHQVSEDFNEVLVEQFINGEEHRFTYINGRIVAIVKRCPANVIGDGQSTIKELVDRKNEEKLAKKLKANKWLILDDEALRILESQGYNPQSVPGNGIKVCLRRNSNVSTGGDSIDVTESMDEEIIRTITRAGDVMPGINVCGIDVLIDDSSGQTTFHIIEVNQSPGFNLHRFPWEGQPRDVAKILVEEMFPQPRTVSLIGWSHFWLLVLYYRCRHFSGRVVKRSTSFLRVY